MNTVVRQILTNAKTMSITKNFSSAIIRALRKRRKAFLIGLVTKMFRHTQITTTQIYARIKQKKVSKDMKKLKTKLLAAVVIKD